MGLEQKNGRETQAEHFQRKSFPLQSAICWFYHEGVSYKRYFHNFGEVETPKDYNYTLDTIRWVLETIFTAYGFRHGQNYFIKAQSNTLNSLFHYFSLLRSKFLIGADFAQLTAYVTKINI
jgi:hypothetical protein